jgi:two-component SAPR family response regulator
LDPSCWVDAYAFEKLLKQGASNGATHHIEKAISLYSGTFLSDTNEIWAVPFRENLHRKFLRAVEKVGNELEKDAQWERAVEYYHKGLDVDNLIEGFYQHLMICYERLGRKGDALSVYYRCYTILHKVLGVEPSHQTEALYKRLMQNSNKGEK